MKCSRHGLRVTGRPDRSGRDNAPQQGKRA